MADRVVRGWVDGGGARALLVEASGLCAETVQRHRVPPAARGLTGDLIVANTLMGAWIKGAERLSLQLQAEAPMAAFFGEIDSEGVFRARMRTDPTTGGEVDGMMLAIKYDERSELYRGMTRFDGEGVESALQRHLVQSDQVMAVVRVRSGPGGRTVGVMVERMPTEPGRPSLDDDAWDALRGVVAAVPAEGLAAVVDGVSDGTLLGHPFEAIDARELTWRCRCSDAGVLQMLRGLGVPMLREMAEEDHGAEVTCHFCNTARRFDEATLRRLADELERAGVAQA